MIGQLPERHLTDGERVIAQFHPHWRTYLPVVAVGVLGLVAVVLGPFGSVRSSVVGLWLAGCALAAVVVTVRRLSTIYVLTTHRLVWRRGIVRRDGVEIPLEQINTVEDSRNLIERLLGYGDLVIESAGANGTSRFCNIPDPRAFQSAIYSTRDARKRSLFAGEVSQSAPPDNAAGGLAALRPDEHPEAARPGRWDHLERLVAMREAGHLTEAEFDQAKRQVLGGQL